MIIHHRKRLLSEAVVCSHPRESTRQSIDVQEENIRTSVVLIYNLQIISICLVECAQKFLTDTEVYNQRDLQTPV